MRYSLIILAVTALMAVSCSQGGKADRAASEAGPLAAYVDSVFTELFIRTGGGFTGGDGTYSVQLPDGRTVWIFGDTFLGTVNPDLTREKISPIYVRNSFVVQDGDSLRTLYRVSPPPDASLVIPPAVQEDEELQEHELWFWPGDGLMENGKLKVFFSEFAQTDTGMWGFEWRSTWLATFSLPDLTEERLEEIPFGREKKVHYGHAILEEQDYTYVYGACEGRPHAARYPAGDVNGPWEFFTGEKWSDDPLQTGSMGDMHASEQFTVLKIKDKYVYITQMESFSKDICSFVSDTPYGPWGQLSLLYTTPIPGDDKNLITYNAIAHPQFMDEKRILVSYNMNSFELEDHFRNADIYRPRFIWVPLRLIDPEF